MVWKENRTTLTGWLVLDSYRIQALNGRVRVVIGQQRQQARDFDAVDDLVAVVPAQQVLRRSAGGLTESFQGGQLGRLIAGDLARGPVTDHHLQRRGDRRGRQRHRQRGALITAPATAQKSPGICAGDQETGDDVTGEVHVHELMPEKGVAEQR